MTEKIDLQAVRAKLDAANGDTNVLTDPEYFALKGIDMDELLDGQSMEEWLDEYVAESFDFVE